MLAGRQCAKVRLLQKASLAPFQFLSGSIAQHSIAAAECKNVMLLVLNRLDGSQAGPRTDAPHLKG